MRANEGIYHVFLRVFPRPVGSKREFWRANPFETRVLHARVRENHAFYDIFSRPIAENHAFYDVFLTLGAENYAFYNVSVIKPRWNAVFGRITCEKRDTFVNSGRPFDCVIWDFSRFRASAWRSEAASKRKFCWIGDGKSYKSTSFCAPTLPKRNS